MNNIWTQSGRAIWLGTQRQSWETEFEEAMQLPFDRYLLDCFAKQHDYRRHTPATATNSAKEPTRVYQQQQQQQQDEPSSCTASAAINYD